MNCCLYCKKGIPDDAVFCSYCGRKQERSVRRKANGTGSIYQRGRTYTAKHRVFRAGQCLSVTKGGFKTKKEAQQWLNGHAVLDACSKRQTIGETYAEWSALHYDKITKKKAQAYQAAWKNCTSIQNLYWDELGLAQMQRCVDSAINTHYQRKTVKTVLRAIEDHAVRNGLTNRQLSQYLQIPPKEKPQKRPFTPEEIQRVWEEYETNPFAGAVLVMLYTGMRYAEISGIRPENIHLDEGYMLGGVKTELGKSGEILIIDRIKPIIRDHMLQRNEYHLSSEGFRKKFNQLASCAGHKPHECRHTTATLLAEADIQPAVIAAIMRHTNYNQTLEYTHVSRRAMIDALTATTNGL